MEKPDATQNKGGRPAKLIKPTKRFINRLILTAIQVTNQLKSESNLDVSADTIRGALKQSGLRAVTKRKESRLLPRHKRAKFEFVTY